MSQPFREAQIAPRDVRRILRRAAELADSDTATAHAERGMTRTELERAAGELGLPATAVARAIDDDAGAELERGPLDAPHSLFLGAPTHLVMETEVAGEPSETDREDLVEEIRDAVGQTGSIEVMGKTLTWRLGSGVRNARDFTVRLRSRNGRTRIVIEERLGQQATGLFVGIGVGGGVGPMGGYIAAMVKFGMMALVIPLLWIPLLLLLARGIFVQLARRRSRSMAEVMKRLTRSAAGWSTAGGAMSTATAAPRLRVDPSVAREEAPAREAAQEDDEEEERALAGTGRARRA